MELDDAIRAAFADFAEPAEAVLSGKTELLAPLLNVIRTYCGGHVGDDTILRRMRELAVAGRLSE